MKSVVIVLLCWLLIACGQANPPIQPSPTTVTNNDPTFSVSLTRTMCHGTCPDYTVTVNSAGIVTFEGQYHVAQTGIHTTTLTPEALTQLVALVDASHVYEFEDAYIWEGFDLPNTYVAVTRNGVSKRIHHYGACWDRETPTPRPTGTPSSESLITAPLSPEMLASIDSIKNAPPALCELKAGIDSIVNTDQWIR